MLKMNNKTILNALDFQKYFAPWEAFRQMEEVVVFARIHCRPLATILKDRKGPFTGAVKTGASGYYGASFINKDFWMTILENGLNQSNWKYTSKSVKACMQVILKTLFDEVDGMESQKKLLDQEYSDARIDEKLQYIISSGKFTGSDQDIRTTVLMLSLCELAEVDVFAQSFRLWETEQVKTQKPVTAHKPESQKDPKKKISETEPKIKSPKAASEPADRKPLNAEYLPKVSVLRLETRGEPYLFYYYEKDVLEKGQMIQTTRIEACMGQDKSKNLLIHLVHPKTKELVCPVVLDVGEYRDCLSVNGKIIKFLPTMSISRNLLVARKPGEDRFEVVPFGARSWTIDMDQNIVRSITCLAAGDEQGQGFLLVSDGKVVTNFYKPCEDYFVRMEMQMVFDTIVEVRIEPEGYCLLTNMGRVISDIPKWNGREHVVTLSTFGRKNVVVENYENISELVMNEREDSLVIRDKTGKIDVLFAADSDRSFTRLPNGCIRL